MKVPYPFYIVYSSSSVQEFRIISFEYPQDYREMLERQHEAWKLVKKGEPSTLFLLQHKPVITLGRRTKEEHLLLDKEALMEWGIDLVRVQRGGSATYHGPGQLVGYIICKVNKFGGTYKLVKKVLQLVQSTVGYFGVESESSDENPGVWTKGENPRKIAAVGMQIKEGISLHGFALNVNMSLHPFTFIVPCGLTLPVTTLSIETGKEITVQEVQRWVIENFKSVLK